MSESLKQIELFARKKILELFLYLHKAPKTPNLPALNQDSTVIFLRLNQIGDALVSTPVIAEIKKRYNCKTVVLADSKNYFIFERNPYVDEVLVYKKNWRGFLDIIREANRRKPDLLIDLHDRVSTTASIFVGRIKAPFKFGLKNINAPVFTHSVSELDTSKYHVVDRLFHILSILNISPNRTELNIVYTPQKKSIEKIQEFLKNNFDTKKPIIGINISAGSENRLWGVQNFKNLVEKLQKLNFQCLILTPPSMEAEAKQIIETNYIFKSPTFDDFATIIGQVSMLFTPDTSAVHLASAFRVPVFGLYVTEHIGHINWYPYQSVYDWIITAPPITNISLEEVLEKLIPFMEKIKLKNGDFLD